VSRSGYIDGDCDPEVMLSMYGWNANVRRCLAGRKGQAFLWELYQALEALPERRLITGGLVDQGGACCSLGAVAIARGIEIPEDLRVTEDGDPDEYEFVDAMGPLLGIKNMLAREVMYQNDECERLHEVPGPVKSRWGQSHGDLYRFENDEERWCRMRRWIVSHLKDIP
jgi:hypothetical protein